MSAAYLVTIEMTKPTLGEQKCPSFHRFSAARTLIVINVNMTEWCFVNVRQPGQMRDTQDAKMIRGHVRKAVLRARGHCNVRGRIQIFTGIKFVNTTVNDTPEQQSCQVSGVSLEPFDTDQHDARHQIIPFISRTLISVRHPYTAYAAPFVQLSIDRIDFLFKSRKLQNQKHYF